MVRRIALSACLAVAALYVAAVATAQDDGAPPPRRFGNLSDRLDQFRQDLLGKKDAPPQEADEHFSVTRKLTRKPRAQRATSTPAPTLATPVEGGEVSEGPVLEPKADYSNLAAPNRLEPQAARRAQPGSAPSPTVVEPVEHPKGILDRIAPPRRPIIVRPPRMGGKDNQAQVETSDSVEKPRHERTAALPARARKVGNERATVEPIDETADEAEATDNNFPEPVSSASRPIAGRPRVNASVDDNELPPPAAAPLTTDDGNADEPQARQQPTLARDAANEPQPTLAPVENADTAEDAVQKEPTRAIDATSEPTPPTTPALRRATESSAAEQAADEPAAPANDAAGLLFTSASPVLSVEATGPRKVLIGKEAAFVVKIKNAGAAANNVVVTINIPNYVEVHGAQATLGTAQPPEPGDRREPLQWKISRLDGGGEEVLNLKLIPRKSTPLDLAIQWTFVPEASQTQVEVQEPKLAMTISGPDDVLYGQSKTYKLTVSNPGNGDTENVVVGLLPIGRSADGAPNHRLGTLAAGESKTIDIELAARQAGALTIKAQAFADGGLRAEATEQVMVRRASLRIDVLAPKVKYAATVGTYRLKVSNAGDANAENVQVTSMLPPETKFVSTTGGGRLDPQLGKVTWNVGSLQAGGERVFELECALLSPGENRTQFVAVADGDLSASTTSTTHVEALADLKLEVRDPQGPIAIGDEAVYEVQIRNRGTKMAEHIDLCVFFSEGLEASSVDGPAHEIATGQVIFKPIVSIGPGDTVNIRVHARAEKPGNHIFRAELTSHHPTTKLAAEEATHFYGEERLSRTQPREGEPTPARRSDDPTPADDSEPQGNLESSSSE